MLRVMLYLALFALIVYLTVKIAERRRGDDPPRGAPRKPIAPDDDPEFLRHLERKRRRDHPDS